MASGKEVILSAKGNGADGVFDQVVVNLKSTTVEVLADLMLAGGQVVKSFADRAFGQ